MNVRAWAEASQVAFLELLYDRFDIVAASGPLWMGPACATVILEPGPSDVARILTLERALRGCAYSDDPLRLYQTAAGVAVELPLPREMRRSISVSQLPLCQGLRVSIGGDGRGRAYVLDLESRPHALIAGASGCGKSEALRTIVTGLARQNEPGEIEMVRGSDGSLHLLEINPRFPAWCYLSAGVGINLPAAVARLAAGEEVAPMTEYRVGTMFVRISLDQIARLEDFDRLLHFLLDRLLEFGDHTLLLNNRPAFLRLRRRRHCVAPRA